ncbi:non-homologous end-joining DNA ligase LigD [Frankia sp. AgKG'84/4]|uniref:non-homologous end-joining DNA ligase LigD n=1 Tax=Frankia sp. AgKG'84/4 TaxID=573490 RepID=UPI00200FFCCA|nr:DNA polymerase ligase N-terminal domain-containing protein [Frankia sp. AgKG'84/4]MCL9794386.1 ATP-dependent DNA ligase [Frankia sp. AgKG'84/4]
MAEATPPPEASGPPPPLAAYRRKRDFPRTPEPAGDSPAVLADGPRRFVVQRHRARRLHYDLRFEIGGVLVSWAVPKGPTLDPAVRRMAVHVEDHPIEYLDFEGVIPAGQYGGGDVIVWDLGTWEPHGTDDPAAAVAAGELHADVTGYKLRGRLVLVRRGGEHQPGGDREQWLLLHKRDGYAVEGWDPEDHPLSVLSGRTNEQVKADPKRMWRADLPAARASVPTRPPPPGQRAGQRVVVAGPTDDELAELDALGAAGSWDVFGRRLRLTNLDKVLFPARPGEEPITKRELVRYAARIAPTVLPYLTGRALNMLRYPNGAEAAGFWHRHLPAHAPDWITRWHRPDATSDGTSTYLVVDAPAALVWAANFGALEWHAWTSPTSAPHEPSYALVDLDPGTATSWDDLLTLARLHRTALDHLQVRAAPKITGRRGIQIWIPVPPGTTFDDTRAWVEELSHAISAVVPDLVSWKWAVRERAGHARLDFTQNALNKTLVAPYSPRAAPGAPISAPLDWDELDDPSLRPDAVTLRTAFDRLTTRGDPFRTILTPAPPLPPLT